MKSAIRMGLTWRTRALSLEETRTQQWIYNGLITTTIFYSALLFLLTSLKSQGCIRTKFMPLMANREWYTVNRFPNTAVIAFFGYSIVCQGQADILNYEYLDCQKSYVLSGEKPLSPIS